MKNTTARIAHLPRTVASGVLRRWLTRANGHFNNLGRLEQEYVQRRDLTRIPVHEGLVIDVFWKSLSNGKGPTLSLYVSGEEFAKFDCHGAGKGHFHLALFAPAPVSNQRIRFAENSVSEQIGRTIFELDTNLDYYLERAASPCARRFKVQRESLAGALTQAERRMREFLLEVPELRDLRADAHTAESR